MHTLWRFTLPHTWNIASSLKTSFSANPSSRSCCWKSKQKRKRRLWSWGFSTCKNCTRYTFMRRMRQTLDWDICNSRLARVVDFWGLLTNVSGTCSTVSADGPGRPVHFAAHRQPLCWNFMFHSRIVLSVGGSVWYMIQILHCTVTIHSVLANSKTQNAFLFTMNAIFHHDYPLAVEPAGTPRPLVQKKSCRHSLPIDTLLSAVSVLVVAQSSSEIPEGLMNNPVYIYFKCSKNVRDLHLSFCYVPVWRDCGNGTSQTL